MRIVGSVDAVKHYLIWCSVEQGSLAKGTSIKLIGENQSDIHLSQYSLLNAAKWITYAEVGDSIDISQSRIAPEDAKKMEYIVLADNSENNT